LNISRSISPDSSTANSPCCKITEENFSREEPDSTFSQLSWHGPTLDDFVIPELKLDKEKPTIVRNLNVWSAPKGLKKRPSLISPGSEHRWSNVELESAHVEMGKKLDQLVDQLHDTEEMESDDVSAITRESSPFYRNEIDYKDLQNNYPNERIDDEENLTTVPVMARRPSLIRPDNLELWSNSRVKLESMEMSIKYKKLSRSVASGAKAETLNNESGPVVDYEIEEDFKTDVERWPKKQRGLLVTEETAELPRNSELNVRSIPLGAVQLSQPHPHQVFIS